MIEIRNIPFLKEQSWNPITGCRKLTPGCDNCSTHTLIQHYQKKKLPAYSNGTEPTVQKARFKEPSVTHTSRRMLVCTMGDFFADGIETNYRNMLFNIMEKFNQHVYIISTKYAINMLEFVSDRTSIPNNIWLGISASTQDWCVMRLKYLKQVPAGVRFLDLTPLIEPIDLENLLPYIDWVRVGGENGKNARYMNPEWAENIQLQCANAGIPFYFKGLGVKSGVRSRDRQKLNGRTYRQYPEKATQRT